MATREDLVRELVALREALKLPALNTVDSLKPDQLEKAVANLRKKAGDEGLLPQSLAPKSTPIPASEPSGESAAGSSSAIPSPPPASEFRPLGAAAREPEPPPAPAARKPGFRVAPGKGITSVRGVLGAGAAVTAADFECGEASLRELLRAGLVVQS